MGRPKARRCKGSGIITAAAIVIAAPDRLTADERVEALLRVHVEPADVLPRGAAHDSHILVLFPAALGANGAAIPLITSGL
jgi:hypothetical protein